MTEPARLLPRPPAPRWERAAWLILGLALLVFRLLYTRWLRAGSDETQHLHVVWAWATGRLPYRDVFDNHTPLFHLLLSPIFRLLGERADIIIPMRVAVLPLYFLALGSVAWLGRKLFTDRIGFWAALAVGFWPLFFFTELEFRTDVLWNGLWMLSLAILLGGALTSRRASLGGLVIGAAFATSLKTTPLVLALLGAVGVALLMDFARERRFFVHRAHTLPVASFLAASLVLPGAIVLYFISRHAFNEFKYGVIDHNLMPGLGHRPRDSYIVRFGPHVFFAAGLLLSLAGGWLVLRAGQAERSVRFRRAVLFLIFAFYSVGMYCYWPLITKQDELPAIPLAGLLIVAALFSFGERLRHRTAWALAVGPAAVLAWIVWCGIEIRDEHGMDGKNLRGHIARLQTILNLTKPDETVMDGKGETIFRARPYYYALENITTARMRAGLLKDDIGEHLIVAGTAVIHVFRLPADATKFVIANYLPLIGNPDVRVLGQQLATPAAGQPWRATVAVAGDYCFLSGDTAIPGTLDGEHADGCHQLTRGAHTFLPDQPASSITIFYQRAYLQGHRPAAPAPLP